MHAAAPSTGIVVYATPHFPPSQYHVPGTPNPLNLPPMPSPGPGFVPVPAGFVPPGVPLASSPAPGAAAPGAPPRPQAAPFFQTVVNPALMFPPLPAHMHVPPAAGQYPAPLPMMHALPLQLVPAGLAPAPPPAAAVAAAAAARLERRREERRRAAAAAEREVAAMCARVGPWLARAPRREVERWCVVRNTDLRAGRWLLHVAPATRKRSGLRT